MREAALLSPITTLTPMGAEMNVAGLVRFHATALVIIHVMAVAVALGDMIDDKLSAVGLMLPL